jgi:hypothetical protein
LDLQTIRRVSNFAVIVVRFIAFPAYAPLALYMREWNNRYRRKSKPALMAA